jgi:hypothetical protein
MKPLILVGLLLTTVPAFAQDRLCIDTSSREHYNARPISQHEVLARNALGDRRAARIATTCIHIYRDAMVALRSMTRCVALGDEVAVSTIDGRFERCKVTGVTPSPESYAEAKYR